MENSNENKKSNLEDIMIDGGNSQKQLKKILMVVALVIVLLIVVVSITRLIIGGDDGVDETPIAAPAPEAADGSQPLFEDVPIDEGTSADEELARMIEQLRDSEQRQQQMPVATAQQDTPEPAQEPVQPEPEVAAEPTPAPTQPEQEQTEAKHDPYAVDQGWYVQVGSFSRFQPNQGFLDEIKSKGYKYYYYRTDVEGTQVTKVLIGRYSSREEATAYRSAIRDEINDGAFLVEVTNGS